MKAFENIEIAFVGVPTAKEVLKSIRRDEWCRADPSSPRCNFEPGKDDYWLKDVASSAVCQRCPMFGQKLEKLMADWEEWVLAMQDVYT